MRLYIDDELIVDGWGEKDANQMVPFFFQSGRRYDIRVEFRNDARGVRVIFGYDHGEETIDRAVQLARVIQVKPPAKTSTVLRSICRENNSIS